MISAKKIIHQLASLKLAVVVIVYICIVIGVGTVVESRLDAVAAKAYVYDSVWMYLGFGALSLSLISVMVDRWPWKKRHASFVLAHVGIITLIIGSVLTMKYGLDGSMLIGTGETQRSVPVARPQILIYASYGDRLSKVFEMPVNFFKRDLVKDPIIFNSDAGEFRFVEFKPYVIPERKIIPADETDAALKASLNLGAGVRFQISNGQFQQIDWMVQRKAGLGAQQDFGPLRVRLGGSHIEDGHNEVILTPISKDEMTYQVFSKDQKTARLQGKVKEGDGFDLGWMGLKLKVLRYHFKAQEKWEIQDREAPTPLTVSAVKLNFKGEDHWIILNDTLRIFTETTAYFVSYVHQSIDLGFGLTLKEFIKESYAGTQKAMEYKSLVDVPELGLREIKMNEPLEYKGLTFYQASFQEDNFGKPTATVLTVNYDPGRPFKYIGSLMMAFGILFLFYFKKRGPKT